MCSSTTRRSPELKLVDILPVGEEHHGRFSCNPPFQRLVVYGARLNEAAWQSLALIALQPEVATVDGFTAIALMRTER